MRIFLPELDSFDQNAFDILRYKIYGQKSCEHDSYHDQRPEPVPPLQPGPKTATAAKPKT